MWGGKDFITVSIEKVKSVIESSGEGESVQVFMREGDSNPDI